MWENTVDPGRPQKILSMRIARCITKATNAHSKCVILFAFPRQQFLCVTLYVHCFSCFIWYMNVLVLYIYTQFDVILFFCIPLHSKSVIQRNVRFLGHIDVRNVIMNLAFQMMTYESGVLFIRLVHSETLIMIRLQFS